ncbi:hypothetical protein N7456_011805 [Penicillium angulare]|uniref:C2H2-type domain-containing protein n=1 Tax=Penicillium angulare TaxID=116970 RepID=A0A9W9EUI8_9EURO|nr:hypothetical protein N7456_011805 [Penicillium angulare]
MEVSLSLIFKACGSDVLQDIMAGSIGANPQDLSTFRSSNVALDNSASNPLLDLHLNTDLASLDPQSHPNFLNQWPSTSTAPQDFYYPNYPASRLAADQDAWNPLLAAGVPNTTSVSHMHMSSMTDPERAFHKPHYRTPSEAGSQYMGSLHSGDSGYASTNGPAHSVVPSSYGPLSSPHIGPNEPAYVESMPFFDQSRMGTMSIFSQDFGETSVKCDHPSCSWVGKCPSDKRKHEARHRKLFKCDEPNCPRKEGFGTINDLARHKKCVHNKEPERGPKMMFLCFGKNCPRPNKKWPRLDNFKQHLSRMHPDEDAEKLRSKSMEWYESVTGHRPNTKMEDAGSVDESFMDAQDHMSNYSGEMEMDSSDSLHYQSAHVNSLVSAPVTPQPVPSTTATEVTPDIKPSHFPSISPIGLLPSPTHEERDATGERGSLKSETFVTDAADNLLNAMTKMVNNRTRRSSQHSDEGIDVESENSQLSQPQRQMLRQVLSVALERLSDDTPAVQAPTDEKQDWFQCDICSKRTRLRCEMKKHQKRHERPYGCTFPHCAKSFGSKADWKRHETSQHLHLPSWLCGLHDPSKGSSCGRIFYREDSYTQHLTQHHNTPKNRFKLLLPSTRLDLADQAHFWCGLCSRSILLQSHGAAALDERFNHIDTEHFKKGERGCDWAFPELNEAILLPGAGANPVRNVGLPSGSELNSRKRKYTGAHSLDDRRK